MGPGRQQKPKLSQGPAPDADVHDRSATVATGVTGLVVVSRLVHPMVLRPSVALDLPFSCTRESRCDIRRKT